jgi:hypothetical protein
VSAGRGHEDRGVPDARWDDEDDLDAAFGPDTASVRTRTGPERVRTVTAVALGVIGVSAVLVVVLGAVLSGVQQGVGGVFPQPEAARDRFVTTVSALPGVDSVAEPRIEKTSFAGYDVTAVVHVRPKLGPDVHRTLVRAVSTAADDAGSGVRIWATLDFGSTEVGVSDSAAISQRRLELAERLGGIGGVVAVRCTFTARPDGRSDDADGQDVVVLTTGRGVAFDAVAAAAEDVGADAFPGVQVRTGRP